MYNGLNQIWTSADRRSHFVYDPGAGTVTLTVEGVAVWSCSSSIMTPLVDLVEQGGGAVGTNTAYGDDALIANTTAIGYPRPARQHDQPRHCGGVASTGRQHHRHRQHRCRPQRTGCPHDRHRQLRHWPLGARSKLSAVSNTPSD
jgi:hypothetical protein